MGAKDAKNNTMNCLPVNHFWLTTILFIGLAACSQPDGLKKLKDHGVVEPYKPDHKITFPHDIHTGVNGIDCKYCHNSAVKERGKGLPTADVCNNCHKHVTGEGLPDTTFRKE